MRENTLAIYLYATMLKNGDGVQKDEITANYLFEKADGENSSYDMLECAKKLYDGLGIKTDKKRATQYFKKSALLECLEAMYHYANMLYNGDEFEFEFENESGKKLAEMLYNNYYSYNNIRNTLVRKVIIIILLDINIYIIDKAKAKAISSNVN